MDKVALLSIVLLAVLVVIVARVVKKRKRAEAEAQQKGKNEQRERSIDELQRAEEERKRIEEEVQHKAQEEKPLWKADKEARERGEQEPGQLETERQQREEKWKKAQNGRRKAEEASKRAEGESQRRQEEAHGEERRPPLDRGGRPRGKTKHHEIGQTTATKHHSLKPEIVCWSEGRGWIIGIEILEELETVSVVQNEEPLEQDDADESRYRLKHVEGTVKVTWTEGEKNIPLIGVGRNPLIFKMRKNWKGLGRLVRHSSTGYYLVIVPREWKRDEDASGHASVAPENIQVDGYKAHFFYQQKDTAIGFITANGERIREDSGEPSFQLVGREIGDASEDMGPLFGEQLPRIQTLDEKGWSDVGVIVVGEEGRGRNSWRMQSIPQVGAEEQKLPEEIANRRGGWYFVRIYDNDDNLVGSMDFRFLASLKDICIEGHKYLPSLNGYDNVAVQFFHQTNCKVELVGKTTQPSLEIRRESAQTIVTVPPKLDCDKSHWVLRDGDAEIEVTVLVERIWWAFGVMGVTSNHWVDKPITLSHKDFTAITDKALWVRVPRMRFVRKIDVGFDRAKSRSYQAEVEKEELAVPLRDFCDAEEIENWEECRLIIWVQSEGTKPDEAVIAEVPAKQLIPQWVGCGRKKTAVAYAVLRQGSGEFTVNDQPVWIYFNRAPRKAKRLLRRLLELEKVKPLIGKMGIDVKVVRSQPTTNRQIKAVTYAVARALLCYDPRLKRLLKDKGFGGVRVTTFSLHGTQFAGDRHRNS